MKCVLCKTRDINPNIDSFCSRICYNIYFRSDYQFIPMSRLKILADVMHDVESFTEKTTESNKNG